MLQRLFKLCVFLFIMLFHSVGYAESHPSLDEQTAQIAMRKVGHDILMASGDSTSRVLPIEKIGDKYVIRFEAELDILPKDLMNSIDQSIAQTDVASQYLVEIEQTSTGQIVHGYAVGTHPAFNVNTCASRDLPKDCYNILITIPPCDRFFLRKKSVALPRPDTSSY